MDAFVTRGAPRPPGDSRAADTGVAATPNAEPAAPPTPEMVARATTPSKVDRNTLDTKKRFNKTVASRLSVPRPLLGAPLAFGDMLEEVLTGSSDCMFWYAAQGSPVARWGSQERGDVVEAIVRRYCDVDEPDVYTTVDADVGTDVNGRKRNRSATAYDFGVARLADGNVLKTEVKSSVLGFDKHKMCWKLHFLKVKPEASDQVLLAVLHPETIDIYVWQDPREARPFFSTKGETTESGGGQIQVNGPCNECAPDAALAAIRTKLIEAGCAFVDSLRYDDPRFADLLTRTRTTRTFADAPLASLSSGTRGNVLERVVRHVLARTLGVPVTAAPPGECVDGGARGASSTACDFLIHGTTRVEVKASLMSWDKSHRRWILQFQAVKPELHDVLYLAFMAPDGVHVFVHDGHAGVSTTGKKTASTGKQIIFCAPEKMLAWQAASRNLLKHLGGYHKLTYVAKVGFGEGDAARALAFGASQCAWLGGGQDEDDEESEGEGEGEGEDGGEDGGEEDEDEDEDEDMD